MPEVLLNTAGKTRTTGTADPVILGGTGKSGSFADVADGTEIAYYRRYASGKEGFENAVGIWRVQVTSTSIGYIDRTSVSDSSNGGAAVSWGVGLQIIDATILPSMLVLDDDARLETVEPGDLGTAASIDGTEKWIAVDGNGDGIDLTAQQVSGNPWTAERGLNRDRVRFWCTFRNTAPAFSSSTTGAQFGAEPYEVYASGTGANVSQALNTFIAAAWPNTGTTTTGYAGLRCNLRPFPYDKTKEMSETFQVTLFALPSTQNFSFQAGFTDGTPGAFNNGIYFRLNNTSAKFQAVVRNGASGSPFETVVDTGVTAAAFVGYVMKWVNDPATASVKFYINGALVATILNSTREVAANTALAPVQEIAKLAGTTAASYVVSNHYIDVKTTALAYY